MLKRAGVDHLLRAAAAITGARRFVLLGTGAAIATQPRLPLAMMLTPELDLYAEESVADASDLLAAAIGEQSVFHRTFGYYADGVGPETALLPQGWRERASVYTSPAAPDVTALCPSLADLAVAKLCAGREKDRDWLRAALAAALLTEAEVAALLPMLDDPRAPATAVLRQRLAGLAAGGGRD